MEFFSRFSFIVPLPLQLVVAQKADLPLALGGDKMRYSEASEVAESLLVYAWDQNTMEDATLTVSRYYGTPEDVGITKHALFSEVLFKQRRIAAQRSGHYRSGLGRPYGVVSTIGQQPLKS